MTRFLDWGAIVLLMVTVALMSPSSPAIGIDTENGDGVPRDIFVNAMLQPRYDHEDLRSEWPCPVAEVNGSLVTSTRFSLAAADVLIPLGTTEREVGGVTERRWISYCLTDSGNPTVTEFHDFWIAVPIPGQLVPAVYDEAIARLAAPRPQWQFVDELDWLYVHTPMTVRVTNLAPVSATASVSNIFGSASASVSARPVELIFTTEAPDTPAVACSIDQLRQSYVPGEGCTVKFAHSSAITDDDHFGYTLTVRWEVESNPPRPDIGAIVETSHTDRIQVAEIQAVVTCQGSGC